MFKNLFPLWGILGFVYCSGDAKQFQGNIELVTSRHTELYLIQENLNSEKKILNSNHETLLSKTSNFQLYQSYQLGDEDILVFLTENVMDSCPKFFIVGIQKGPQIVHTPEFGNCSDSPEISQNSNNIEFLFPMSQSFISQTVVYKNQKIEVTERKVSKK